MIKVKNRQSGKIVEAIKDETGNYSVEGQVLSKEEMGAKYVPYKEEPKAEVGSGTILSETEHSASIGKLALALSKAQSEFSGVKKDSSGYSYNYADLNAVITSSAPIFTKHELAITQDTLGCVVDGVYYTGVKTMIIHSSGEWKSATAYIPTERTKQNPLVQMFGVNSTYLRRYQYQAVLGLATTDSDGNG